MNVMNVSAEQLKQLRDLCEKAEATLDDAHEEVVKLSAMIGQLQDEEAEMAFQSVKQQLAVTRTSSKVFDEVIRPIFQPTRRAL